MGRPVEKIVDWDSIDRLLHYYYTEGRTKFASSSRILKRSLLMNLLPLDLAFQYGVEKGWNFGGELLRRRHSSLLEDQAFFEFLRLWRKDIKLVTSEWRRLQTKLDLGINVLYKDLTLWSLIYCCLEFYGKSDNEEKSNSALFGELGLALADIDPDLSRQIINMLSSNGQGKFETASIARKLGDKIDISKSTRWLLESTEYYAAGKLALLADDLGTAKYCVRQMIANLTSPNQKIPTILTQFVPLSSARNRYLLATALSGSKKTERFQFSLSMVELAQEIAFKESNQDFAKELFKYFLDKNCNFEAGMLAIELGDLEFAKKLRPEFYAQGRLAERLALTLLLAEKNSEFGWQILESWLKEHQDMILPPIAASLLGVVLAKDQNLTLKQKECLIDMIKKLTGAGGPLSLYLTAMISIGIRARIIVKEIVKKGELLVMEGGKEYWLGAAAAFLKSFPEPIKNKKILGAIRGLSNNPIYNLELVKEVLAIAPQNIPCLRSMYLTQFPRLEKYLNDPQKIKSFSGIDYFYIVYFQVVDPDSGRSEELLIELLSKGKEYFEKKSETLVRGRGLLRALRFWLLHYGEDLKKGEVFKLLEIASCYKSSDIKSRMHLLLSRFKSYPELISEAEKLLIRVLGRKFGVNKTLLPKEWKIWQHCYTSYILRHHDFLKDEPKYTQELYRQIICAILENRFSEFISDLEQDNPMGRKIAAHNKKVEEDFRKAGINWENWLGFRDEGLMSVIYHHRKRQKDNWQKLEQKLNELENAFKKTPIHGSLRKDILALKKQKHSLVVKSEELKDPNLNGAWMKNFFPTYLNGIAYLKRHKKKKDLKLIQETAMEALCISEQIRLWLWHFVVAEEFRKKFRICLWRRDPARDLFQGNFSGSCVAIGSETIEVDPSVHRLVSYHDHPAGVLEYLVDKGIQVAEVIDEDLGETIAQCWVFLSFDENQKPILVADTLDLRRSYKKNFMFSGTIRDAVFIFLKNYAKAIGASRVVLGKKGRGSYRIQHCVDVSSLLVSKLPPIRKLGGYWDKRNYFLETCGAREAFLIV